MKVQTSAVLSSHWIYILLLAKSSRAFFLTPTRLESRYPMSSVALNAKGESGGKGFGISRKKASSKGKGFSNQTYGSATWSSSIDAIIDSKAAMSTFFESNREWDPLFRSLISSMSIPAIEFFPNDNYLESLSFGGELAYDDQSPWKPLQSPPTDPTDLSVIATFLDNMQKSLTDIPVNENTKDDASDLHFLEEGRRMLMISRFQVLSTRGKDPEQRKDLLFRICWSELAELHRLNQEDNGSLILLPDYKDMGELKTFVDENLHCPLNWLGVVDHYSSRMTSEESNNRFEVATFERGILGIRIIHNLSDIPEVEPQAPMTMS